jgi:hypothetical protein
MCILDEMVVQAAGTGKADDLPVVLMHEQGGADGREGGERIHASLELLQHHLW